MKPEAEEETQAQTPVMKRFDDLSARELYEILRLRSEIFIVVTEQLKKDNPYEWIGRMNNIQACVREVVGTVLIYT